MGSIRYVCTPGAGFTGTTLLGFLLNAHPECVTIGEVTGLIDEVDLRDYRCSCGALFVECAFWKELGERLARAGSPMDLHRTGLWDTHFRVLPNRYLDALLIRSLRNTHLTRARDAVVSRLAPVRRSLESTLRLNVAFARCVLDLSGKSVFVDSSQDHLRPRLLSRSPELDLRVIHLIRDVRANVASILKHDPRVGVARAARIWRRANLETERVRRSLPADRWLRVPHGALCAEPQRWMDRIAAFIGISPAPLPADFREPEHHIVGNSMRLGGAGQVREDLAWTHRFGPADLARIARVAGATNRAFGFDWPPEP